MNSARTQRYSIFIGGVARTTTARESANKRSKLYFYLSGNLAETIDNAIGDVVAVRIEVDYDTEYPKGAARVIFATEKVFCHRYFDMACNVEIQSFRVGSNIKYYRLM